MEVKPNKIAKDIGEKLAPHLQNSILFYVAAAAVIFLTFLFVAYPAYSGIVEGYEKIDDLNLKIEDYENKKEALLADYNALKTRIEKTYREAEAAISAEILPTEPMETELVRFFERKVQQFNVSSRDFLEISSISFSKPKFDAPYPYLPTKITLEGSYENFYRFVQMIEHSGIVVEVADVEKFSSAYEAGFKKGDVLEYVLIDEENKEPVLFPWVLTERMKDMVQGEEKNFEVRRYEPKTGIWNHVEINYVKQDDAEDTGLDLVVADDYSRQMTIEKISMKIKEGDEITGEGESTEFSLEIFAYFLPTEEQK